MSQILINQYLGELFRSSEIYGPEFGGVIHVHHVPLAAIGEEYVVDPIRDLCPVCPDCHMALHSPSAPTIESLRARGQSRQDAGSE